MFDRLRILGEHAVMSGEPFSVRVEGRVLQDVAVNSRSYLALVQIAPGVVHTNPVG